MTFEIHITMGKAAITPDGLRCRGTRDKSLARVCNKLLVKKSATGQIAGNFRCERCRQEIEVELALRA